jgi:hypothetical protein
VRCSRPSERRSECKEKEETRLLHPAGVGDSASIGGGADGCADIVRVSSVYARLQSSLHPHTDQHHLVCRFGRYHLRGGEETVHRAVIAASWLEKKESGS